MEFITDYISTGKAKSFDDLVREYKQAQSGNKVKTASVKVAEQDEADSSGQLDVEPLHQEGESTTMPKNGPKGKKEAAANEADEADSSGQLDVEPLHLKGESTTMPKNGPKGKKDAGKEKAVVKDEKEETKEAGVKGNCEKCKKPNFLCKCDGEGDGECDKEASKERRFVKIANLDEKNETFLRDYWRLEFPEDFVNAMLAKK